MAKNNNKNKTTKHTIEFSNNTLEHSPVNRQPCHYTPRHKYGQLAAAPLGPARVVMYQLLYALDLRSETDQIFHEQRIAAVDVKDIVHLGVTVSDQPGQHQTGAGPDVR